MFICMYIRVVQKNFLKISLMVPFYFVTCVGITIVKFGNDCIIFKGRSSTSSFLLFRLFWSDISFSVHFQNINKLKYNIAF